MSLRIIAQRTCFCRLRQKNVQICLSVTAILNEGSSSFPMIGVVHPRSHVSADRVNSAPTTQFELSFVSLYWRHDLSDVASCCFACFACFDCVDRCAHEFGTVQSYCSKTSKFMRDEEKRIGSWKVTMQMTENATEIFSILTLAPWGNSYYLYIDPALFDANYCWLSPLPPIRHEQLSHWIQR